MFHGRASRTVRGGWSGETNTRVCGGRDDGATTARRALTARATPHARARAVTRAVCVLTRATTVDDDDGRRGGARCAMVRVDVVEDESPALGGYARASLERAKARAAALELENHALVVANRREVTAAEARVADERRGLEETRARLAREREALTEREGRLRAFADDRAAHDAELARVKEECARLTTVLEKERAEMERTLAARLGATRAECDARVTRAKEVAESTMTARMERSVKRILAQNRKMADELRVQVSETDALHRRLEQANDEATSLRRRAAVAEQVEKERAELGALRAKEMRKADEKIAALECGIRDIMEAFETQKREWENETKALRSANEEEVAHLKRSIALKSRELTNIKKLAREVICHYEDV